MKTTETTSAIEAQNAAQTQSTLQVQAAAIKSAQNWLELVDKDQYAQSWAEAAKSFQRVVPKDKWESSLQAFRRPLGRLVSRKLTSQQYKTALPGAPDGQYVIIQYKTEFQNKRSAVETVTPMLDTDGQWRISGYYIK